MLLEGKGKQGGTIRYSPITEKTKEYTYTTKRQKKKKKRNQNNRITENEAFRDLGGGERVWQITIVRNLNDWLINEYVKLLGTLSRVYLDGSNDSAMWSLTKNRLFLVKSYYKFLTKHDHNSISFPVRQIGR